MKNRQALLTIHRWLGLTLALLLVVQGGTGVAMVFRDEIEPVIHPELRVAPAPTRLSMQQLFDTVRTTHPDAAITRAERSEEHTSEIQSLMRISYAVFCLKKKKTIKIQQPAIHHSI